jgi:hypothetical protein
MKNRYVSDPFPICALIVALSPCSNSFVDLLLFPFDGFWEMCGENSRNISLLLFVEFWVLVFATLCRRAVLIDAVACLPVARAFRPVGFFAPFWLVGLHFCFLFLQVNFRFVSQFIPPFCKMPPANFGYPYHHHFEKAQ